MMKALIICGPTATGKTKLASTLARRFNGELINADSRQMFRGFAIISGKDVPPGAKPEYRFTATVKQASVPLYTYRIDGVPIWLLDTVTETDEVSVSLYRELAHRVIEDISSRGKLPIIVGGTGYYLSSLTRDIETIDIPRDSTLRRDLDTLSVRQLQDRLEHADPDRWGRMNDSDRNNPRRLVRAIEVAGWSHANTGGPRHELAPVDLLWIGLTSDPEKLGKRIEERVTERFDAGAAAEVRHLTAGELPLQAATILGVPILIRYVRGELGKEEAIRLWQTREVQYAKRQMVWFKKQKGIRWFSVDDQAFSGQVVLAVTEWYTI